MSNPAASSDFRLTGSTITPRERRPICLLSSLRIGSEPSIEVLLLDLSHGGCGIETPVPLEPGRTVTLMHGHQSVEADVRWYSQCRAGLGFKPQQPRVEPRRREVRTILDAQISIRRLGANKYRVQAHDLSSGGCKIDLIERPRIGEHVLVKFDGLEVLNACVCWVDGYWAGVSFDKPIHPAVLDLLLAKSKR